MRLIIIFLFDVCDTHLERLLFAQEKGRVRVWNQFYPSCCLSSKHLCPLHCHLPFVSSIPGRPVHQILTCPATIRGVASLAPLVTYKHKGRNPFPPCPSPLNPSPGGVLWVSIWCTGGGGRNKMGFNFPLVPSSHPPPLVGGETFVKSKLRDRDFWKHSNTLKFSLRCSLD